MRILSLMLSFALVAGACGGGDGGGCEAIVDEGVDLLQQAIDDLAGLTLSDIESDPFDDPELGRQFDDLEQRSNDEGCSDEELNDLFLDGFNRLEAGEDNPAGTFLVSVLQQAANEGGFQLN